MRLASGQREGRRVRDDLSSLLLQPHCSFWKPDVVADKHSNLADWRIYWFYESTSCLNDLRFTELEFRSVNIKQVELPVHSSNLAGGIDDDVGVEDLSSGFAVFICCYLVYSTKADPQVVGGAGKYNIDVS